jgi:hypothetical protein
MKSIKEFTKLTLLFFTIALSACNNNSVLNSVGIKPQELSKTDYEAWAKSNPSFSKEKEIGKVVFECRYIPAELLMNEQTTDSSQSKLDTDTIHFFKISISPYKGSKETVYAQFNKAGMNETDFFNHLNFEYGNSIYLTNGSDTLPCASYIFERGYNLAPSISMLVGFAGASLKKQVPKTLVINDDLFDCGILNFQFDPELFRNNPNLILD